MPTEEGHARGVRNRMKMYILVRDDIPLGFAMVAVAHASPAGYLEFQDEPETRQWLAGPFLQGGLQGKCQGVRECETGCGPSGLDRIRPGEPGGGDRLQAREEWPKMFKFLRSTKMRRLPCRSPDDASYLSPSVSSALRTAGRARTR